MAELSEYAAVIDQAINELCDEAGISRETVDAAVEADRAAMAPRWEAEARLAERMRQRQAELAPALKAVFEEAARALPARP